MYSIIKRFFDFIASAVILIVFLPIILLTALFVCIHFKENPIFTQRRIGKNNKPFRIFKFKSMTSEKDADGNLLPNEERLTNTGKALRKSSLDELPQMINVLNGSMSLIGPRPMGTHYLDLLSEEQLRRHECKPGISGWAQVNGRDEVTPTEKFKLDLWYVENQNFFTDFRILLRTVTVVVRRAGTDSRASDENFPDNGNYNTNLNKSSKTH